MTQQQAGLLFEADLPRANRGNGASSTRLGNRSRGSQSMINGIATIPPKGAIPLHYHNCENGVMVLSGTGTAVVGETELAVEIGDVTWTPANLSHQFHNGSESDNKRIFFAYASARATCTMVKTGETHLSDAEHKA